KPVYYVVYSQVTGFALLLHGKVTFGYIYGIGLLGCVGMYALMNLMAADKTISLVCTASVLGYCLLPMSLLSLVTVLSSKFCLLIEEQYANVFIISCIPMYLLYYRYLFRALAVHQCFYHIMHFKVSAILSLSIQGIVRYSLSILAVIWCSSSSSKLFVIALSMHHQRILVAYPCVLLYSVFALLAIF
ncbi:Yip1 domain protein, partial [Dictyocaulus viviparus]